MTQGRKPSDTRDENRRAGERAQHSSRRCHVYHQDTILPYFQGGRGSFQGGPPLLSHGSSWGPQEVPKKSPLTYLTPTDLPNAPWVPSAMVLQFHSRTGPSTLLAVSSRELPWVVKSLSDSWCSWMHAVKDAQLECF